MLKNLAFFPKPSILLNIPVRYKNNARIKTLGSSSSSDKTSTKKQAMQHAIAMQNRTKWERQLNHELKSPPPPSNSSVYNIDDFRTHSYSLEDAIHVFKTASHPEIFDCLENPLQMKLFINMKTKSPVKFISPLDTNIVLPHLLTFQPVLNILIICKDSVETDSLKNCGAKFVGDEDLMEKLTTGLIHSSEYDVVLGNLSMEKSISKLKNVLKDKLPTQKSGQLSENLAEAYEKTKDMILIKSHPIVGVPEENYVNLTIGQVTWPNDKLKANIVAYLDNFERQKSNRLVGSLFTRAELFLKPIDISLKLDIAPFISAPNKS